MAKYHIQTDGGTFEVETDEPSAPPAPAVPGMRGMPLPGMPKAPLPKNEFGQSELSGGSQIGIKRGLTSAEREKVKPALGSQTFATGMDQLMTGEDEGQPGRNPLDVRLGGAAKAIGGFGAAASPALIGPSLMAAPAATLGSLAGGVAGSAALGGGSRLLGAPEGVSEALGLAGGVAGGIPGARIPEAFRADPFVAATRALKPTPSAEGLPLNLRQNIAAVKKFSPGFEPAYDPATGTTNIAEGFNAARMAHHEALEPYFNRAQGYGVVPHQGILEATRGVVNGLPASERAAAQSYITKAQQDWAGLSPREMRAQIDRYNARDASFYNKGTSGQSAALSQAEQAIDKAQADAARDALYRHISPEDEGAGPRMIRGNAGNLHELENEALRRTGSIVAEQPLTPFGRAIEPVVAPIKAAWGAVRGNPGAGISYAANSGSRSIPLLRKAFNAVDEDYAPLPKPASEMYPTIPPSRQLGPGPIRLPEGAPPEAPPVPRTFGNTTFTRGPESYSVARPRLALPEPTIKLGARTPPDPELPPRVPFTAPYGKEPFIEQQARPAQTFVKRTGESGQPPITKGPAEIPRDVNAAEEQERRPAKTFARRKKE